MNWYTRYLKKQAVQGEWWIDGGSAAYCDGDVGDWTHEGYVLDMVASQYVDTSEIEETVNSLPWGTFDILAVEDLRGIKTGKSKKRSRDFRRSVAPWTVRRVNARVAQRCEENRVLLVTVAPAYTSRTCPQCGCCDERNRNGESFKCVGCGHAADADFVGALNVKQLGSGGSLESPQVKKDK